MSRQLVIVGGGGFAKEIAWLAEKCGYRVVGYLDDNAEKLGKKYYGYTVLGGVNQCMEHKDSEFIVAIGNPETRRKVVERISATCSVEYATLIHPNADMSDSVKIEAGSIVGSGCILTVDITIGSHSILNLNVTIGHDVCMGDYCTVAPMVAISGNVNIENLVEIGTGALVKQGVLMEKGAMLGMGSVLTKDSPAYSVMVGNPARKIKSIST